MPEKDSSLLSMFLLGTVIRTWLIGSDFQQVIAQRIEVSTPLNSWKRGNPRPICNRVVNTYVSAVVEGLHLRKLGVDPYSGDSLHETPLHLTAYQLLMDTLGSFTPFFFVLLDVATACLLYFMTKKYMRFVFVTESGNSAKYSKEADKLLLKERDLFYPPRYVVAIYLFNPYTIFNCVGQTTTVFGNFFLALHLVGMMYGKYGKLYLKCCSFI